MKTSVATWELPIRTADGTFTARYSAHGLCRLRCPSDATEPAPETNSEPPARLRQWHKLTETAVIRTLAGKAVGALPPFDFIEGTEFQQSVWQAMRTIGTGKTLSYGEIARKIGRPAAVRAVGGACGANPIPLLIPCHRVLAAGGKIGGFTGGLKWKRHLLDREGTKVTP